MTSDRYAAHLSDEEQTAGGKNDWNKYPWNGKCAKKTQNCIKYIESRHMHRDGAMEEGYGAVPIQNKS